MKHYLLERLLDLGDADGAWLRGVSDGAIFNRNGAEVGRLRVTGAMRG